ncbi:UvrD-helicase domain-containing protein [Ectobacillus sp. JY-23]|uniref:RNA polymerase recycling motor HelD n=1 Tax=Ectobacillus sp. JY-23 TaxID=2933872 RepID=UPI001FF55BCC|nr:RNA polymerase recycling motor HelD [Ectobacillus sp. JY-23]UOY92818.1 UvrD-helicase domain-containing protein [Ectobacillus sp. JY-23]
MSKEIRQEQKRLDHVMAVIADQTGRLEKETQQRRKEVVDIRKHFWDDLKVNTDTFDDYLETVIGLRQQAQALSVTQGIHRHAFHRLSVLHRMQKSPYFGRIDFVEEDAIPEQIYIGIATLTDTSGEEFLIYDWRAPVASVYYDYGPGPAKYDTPEGEIHGTLKKKWQYIIRNGVVESLFDTSLTIGDEILQQVLGKSTDKYMHNIVATIQQEQNHIIRHDHGRLLIVQGAAGSGKTSAALQRIAYLLYKYRDRLKADQIILFSPNPMFNSYVANVLPELGEENMQQVTFQEYLNHRLGRSFQVEDPYEQLEYVLTATNAPFYQARTASIKFKASTQFVEIIKAYRLSLEESGMRFKGIKFRGKPVVTARQISEKFYSSDNSLSFQNKIEKLREWLSEMVDEMERVEQTRSWVQEEIELLSKDEYQRIYIYLQKKQGLTNESVGDYAPVQELGQVLSNEVAESELDDYEKEHKALRRMIVRKKLKPLRTWIRALRFIDFTRIYKQLFTNPRQVSSWTSREVPKEWEDICILTTKVLDEGKLFYEDATPFLFLKELMQGFHTNNLIKHVLIDEAQDYSPFQFEFLKRLFPTAKMTVLGDFNQAIFAHASEKIDFQMLTNLYGPSETNIINLTRSYRSTRPITEFTRELVPDGEHINTFARDGVKPILMKVSNHTELHRYIISKVIELQKRGYHTIAVICKSIAESTAAYEALNNIEAIKLIKSGSAEYEQGVLIIPAYLAKGIEFDAVIIYDASMQVYGNESIRRLFYTACTRALHELYLYSVGEPSLFLQHVGSEKLLRDRTRN